MKYQVHLGMWEENSFRSVGSFVTFADTAKEAAGNYTGPLEALASPVRDLHSYLMARLMYAEPAMRPFYRHLLGRVGAF